MPKDKHTKALAGNFLGILTKPLICHQWQINLEQLDALARTIDSLKNFILKPKMFYRYGDGFVDPNGRDILGILSYRKSEYAGHI